MNGASDQPSSSPAPQGGWLIVGAGGFIGSSIAEHLRSMDGPVTTLAAPRLSIDPSSDLPALAEAAGRNEARAILREAMINTKLVVIAAGLAKPDASWSAELVGANSLLPAVVAIAAQDAGVRRVIHLSSASVQGRTRVLTESSEVNPFSAYSKSKAVGEQVLQRLPHRGETEIVAIRATSVQGLKRPTTISLRRVARSPLSSVAGDGTQPSAISSIRALCEFITAVGLWPGPVPSILLQPWEGMSVAHVLIAAGGRQPARLPEGLCEVIISTGYAFSRLAGGRWVGQVRRVEAMWFGQEVRADWSLERHITINRHVRATLKGELQ